MNIDQVKVGGFYKTNGKPLYHCRVKAGHEYINRKSLISPREFDYSLSFNQFAVRVISLTTFKNKKDVRLAKKAKKKAKKKDPDEDCYIHSFVEVKFQVLGNEKIVRHLELDEFVKLFVEYDSDPYIPVVSI